MAAPADPARYHRRLIMCACPRTVLSLGPLPGITPMAALDPKRPTRSYQERLVGVGRRWWRRNGDADRRWALAGTAPGHSHMDAKSVPVESLGR